MRRATVLFTLLTSLVLCAAPAPVSAQRAENAGPIAMWRLMGTDTLPLDSLRVGSRVRISAWASPSAPGPLYRRVGIIKSVAPDTIVFAGEVNELERIPLDRVTRLDISRPSRPIPSHVIDGVAAGLGAGFLLAQLATLAASHESGGDCQKTAIGCSRATKGARRYLAVGLLFGGVTGLALGLSTPGDRWIPVRFH